jgi:hypothetical protein
MHAREVLGVALSVCLAAVLATGPASAADMAVKSDKTVTTVKFPETVAYDPTAKVLYVSEFVSALKPTEKDGKGRISKRALDGSVIEEQFLPAAGQVLNKPKGIWVAGNHLWVTDIDSVWEFDTRTKKGKKIALPGAKFANDVAVLADSVYVSDNRGDALYRVEPADFLNGGAPKVTKVFSGKSVNPNGIFPAADGSLLMVGYASPDQPRGIFAMNVGEAPKALSEPIGRLDGVYELKGGDLLVTDWKSGALGRWQAGKGFTKLAEGFKGPADFAVVPNADGLLVVVPDLAKSELRLIQLSQ